MPLVIVIAIALKCVIYIALRRSRFMNRSAISVALLATLAICAMAILAGRNLTAFSHSLFVTVSMDLMVLSYVRYRDALRGESSRL